MEVNLKFRNNTITTIGTSTSITIRVFFTAIEKKKGGRA
jgi:hypothetical protein